MASHGVTLAAVLVATVAGLCAYTNHKLYVQDGEKVVLDTKALHRDAKYAAEVAMQLQYECLAKNPSDWCNRDLQFQNHYKAAYRDLATKHKYEYALGSTSRQDRNQWLLVLAVSG